MNKGPFASTDPVAPTLLLGWGNPSRGDDALAPLLLEQIASMQADHPEWGAIALLTDFQLQIEHALDLQGRRRVLFVDACAENGAPPFAISEISANPAANLASHRLSPQAVMQVYQTVQTSPLPSCHLLAIRGTSFELGAGLSPEAKDNLEAALSWTCDWLAEAAKDCCQIHTGEMTVC